MSMKKNSSKNLLLAALVGGISGAIVGACLTYYFGFKVQIKVNDYQKRQQVISQLTGRKLVTRQLYTSYLQALIYWRYHEAKWKLTGQSMNSFQFQEARYWHRQSQNFIPEISRSNCSLFETVGLIKILFPHKPDFTDLVNQIENFEEPTKPLLPDNMSASQLESWIKSEKEKFEKLVELKYIKPIDDLLDYLTGEFSKEEKKILEKIMDYKKCQFCGEVRKDVKIRKWLRVKVEDERLLKEDDAMKPVLACDRCWEENQKSKK